MENSGLRLSDTVCTATLGPTNFIVDMSWLLLFIFNSFHFSLYFRGCVICQSSISIVIILTVSILTTVTAYNLQVKNVACSPDITCVGGRFNPLNGRFL
jgi:hypothetical protein